MLCFAASEQTGEAHALASCADRVEDDSLLRLDLGVMSVLAMEGGEHTFALLVSLTAEKPSRRFWKEHYDNREEETKYNLESDGPSLVNTLVIGELRTVVDPISNDSSERDRSAPRYRSRDHGSMIGAFGLICGNS
ncbi:hypothetical protein VC83_00814 [Pseudogymnoascus destructans]|uniref:Uncharacterized protein n=1 Tax=Pseudogymnoascus destructans TaxID=655981 RepID=A0A177AKX4_9PEZI|nr:uncharacterized protein VC83_00814 [Pseudogymnoascus destructans]OAF62685.1 hypothetical protein VC83_00814 [Pseudogymnoascus destructans]